MQPSISDYELLRVIGRGSYGDVWLARGVTGLYRAVKLVWRDRFPDLQPYEREFKGLREFAAISLSEARQLALLHVGRNDAAGFFYYVMELADDVDTGRDIQPERYVPRTLKAVQERQGPLSANEVVTLGVDLARGLAGLHRRGLVHRDVKPSNVIFVGGAPKLADIGLVTAATAAHTFVGTEGFVPPEGPGTPAADVFSLGKLLYESATGLDRNDYPRLPPDLNARNDRKELLELNEIVIRACDPVAARRYADAAALLDDLLLLQAGRSMRRLRAAERRLARAVRIGAVLALVASVAGTGAFVERRRAQSENVLRRQAETERDELARKAVYAAGLARAQRALELGDLGRAREHLGEIAPAAGEPDLRGFEWHALWSEAQGAPAQVLRASGPAADRVRFSPDGKWIAVHTADKRVALWDAATKQLVRTLEGVHRLAGFSADGRWVVGSDPQFALHRWTSAEGTPDVQPASGTNRPLATIGEDRVICFTDGASGTPHALRVWDFSRRAEVARIEIGADADGSRWDFYRAAVSHDGALCAVALIAGRILNARWKITVWDWQKQQLLYSEVLPHRLPSLAFSHDKRSLAVALGETAEVGLLDLHQPAWRWRKHLGTAQANAIAFSTDDRRLAVAGRDQVVRTVLSDTGELETELHGQNGVIDDLAWSPAGEAIVSVSNSGDIRLWPDTRARGRRMIEGLWAPRSVGLARVCVSPDGSRLAVPRDGRSVEILATDSFLTVATLAGALNPVAFSDDSATLLTATATGAVQRWNVGAAAAGATTELQLFDGQTQTPIVMLSPDHRWLVATSPAGRIQFWDFAGRQLAAERPGHTSTVWTAAFSPDGHTVVTSGMPGPRVWHSRTGEVGRAWDSAWEVYDAAFLAGRAQRLALAGSNGDVELRALPSMAVVRRLRTSSARIQTLAFSPDGTRLVCAGPRGMVHIFATDDWRELMTLAIPPNKATERETVVANVAFSANGRVLTAYLADGRLRLWRW